MELRPLEAELQQERSPELARLRQERDSRLARGSTLVRELGLEFAWKLRLVPEPGLAPLQQKRRSRLASELGFARTSWSIESLGLIESGFDVWVCFLGIYIVEKFDCGQFE